MARNRNDQRIYTDNDQRQHPYRSRNNEETRRSGEFYDDMNEDYGDNFERRARYDDRYMNDDEDVYENSGYRYDDVNNSYSRRYENENDGDRYQQRHRRGYREFQPTDNRRNFMSHPRQEGLYQSNEYGQSRGNWNRDSGYDSYMNRNRGDYSDRYNNERNDRYDRSDNDQQRQYSRRGFALRNNEDQRWGNNDTRWNNSDQRWSNNEQRWGNNEQRWGNAGNNRQEDNDQQRQRNKRGSNRRDY